MRFKNSLALIFSFFLLYNFGNTTDELPIPTYNNSVIISIELNPWDSDEVDYIKENFNFGMYAWLSISHTHIAPVLDWHSDWSNPSQEIKGQIGRGREFNIASEGIPSFKDFVNSLIEKAKEKKVLLHIVLCSGMARSLSVYKEAKEEDIRNCQWFNDNKLASDNQYNTDPNFLNNYVFGTVSRYARKMRANLEAKSKAILTFLKQKMDENPDVLIALSGWGELELNFLRQNDLVFIQDYFCDFSPFAVMEFRDWICHTGMYDDETGKYLGQGYSEGGGKYQGQDGLNQFNQDFGTNFTTWNLKYYNWSLSDDYDENPADNINSDPNRIPISEYDHGNMLSAYRANYAEGGFDPPRVMGHPEYYEGHSKFWDLFNLFRETMVHNAVKDMAKWAYEAGISTEKWYSHGIPGDYLYGYNPDMPYKNARYYTSGSPLWASNINPYGSMGATIYDIKFPTHFVRTTQYGVPAISSMSTNWAIMEYDAETYPVGYSVTPSTADFILEQFLKTYDYYCHFYNFWKWLDDTGEHRIKGTNKETALKNFIEKINDIARMAVNTVFDPPKVTGFSGQYSSSAGGAHAEAGEAGSMQLELTGKIWNGYSWEWTDWGDFSYFEIYRSTDHNFTPSSNTWLANTNDYSYEDSSIASGKAYFYRIRVINSNSGAGPYSDELMLLPSSENVPVLHVDKKNLTFKVSEAQTLSTSESVNIENLGAEGTTLNWQASTNQSWLSVTPTSGTGNAAITVSVDTTGLALGTYSGEVKIEDPNAINSPQLIEVLLSLAWAEINLPSTSIAFGKKKIGGDYESELVLENKGNADLTIASITQASGNPSAIDTASDYFTVVSFPSSISPGSSGNVVVKFSPVEKKEYTAKFTINSNALENEEVEFDVSGEGVGGATLGVSTNKITFGTQKNGSISTPESVLISNSGDMPLNWQVTKSDTWIIVSSTSGTDDTLIDISADPTGLSEGTYTGKVSVADPEASNSPQDIEIVQKVIAPQTDAAPFGSFDTPIDGSTVSGSISVTGWALDDRGVSTVQIKRSSHPDDPPGAIGPDGLVYIGDGIFVKGARPDLEAAYPDYPRNDRAGWGYMMLTNFLPNEGNGTFILHAFAFDESDHVVELGSKTIHCDNANRAKPFGTLDTPAQGGTASGNSYINFGWTLTPLPKYIPKDGSTIWVYIDSYPAGNPVYNQYRADISNAFPGYYNSDGAVGFYYIDTTEYENGVHTISWTVTDNEGASDGIGSRYFQIQNTSGDSKALAGINRMSFKEDLAGRLKIEVETEGDRKAEARSQKAPSAEKIELDVEELGMIKLQLRGESGNRYIGWAADEDRNLPIGSTLDNKTGIFYWMPGPGFLGKHILHFAVTNGKFRSKPVEITINIIPKKYQKRGIEKGEKR